MYKIPTELSEKYGCCDLLTAYIMRQTALTAEQSADIMLIIMEDIDRMIDGVIEGWLEAASEEAIDNE